MKIYFEILGLSENATITDIKRAYRQLAKRYHPDINHSKDGQEKFIAITEAYEILTNKGFQQKPVEPEPPEQDSPSTNYKAWEDFERFKRETREKAKRQAEMRYEEFKRQHESFQERGVNDVALLFKIFVRIVIIPIIAFLVVLPVYIALNNEWTTIFILFVTWPFAGILGWFVYDNRKGYFMPGKFYYSFERIKKIYTEKSSSTQQCYYCKTEKADSRAYKIELLRPKDVKFVTGGFQQHSVSYVNESVVISIPRSQKALIVHSLVTVGKIISLLLFLIFSNISSIVWRTIFGLIVGGLLGGSILLVSRTRSNKTYLFNYGTIARIIVWVLSIILVSQFNLFPFDVSTSDFIYFVVTSILMFDCLLMQLTNYLLGNLSNQIPFKQYGELTNKLDKGYIEYNEVPVVSVVFPIFKWIFG